jgi:hypothetical protein
MEECKDKKCNFKCSLCNNYDKARDYCLEKDIEYCSKQVHTDFSQCDSYLVRENLIMF